MPSKSKAQHNLMALVANDPKAAKRLGISKSVGEDYMKADKGRKFKEGGALKEVDSGENPGLSKLPTEVRNKMGYMKKGGMAKKYKEGGMADMAQDKKMAKKAVGMHEKQLHGGKKSDLTKLKKGGACKSYAKGGDVDLAGYTKHGRTNLTDTEREVGPSQLRMKGKGNFLTDAEEKAKNRQKAEDKGMKKGGMCKGYARGGGIEVRGKTKGRII